MLFSYVTLRVLVYYLLNRTSTSTRTVLSLLDSCTCPNNQASLSYMLRFSPSPPQSADVLRLSDGRGTRDKNGQTMSRQKNESSRSIAPRQAHKTPRITVVLGENTGLGTRGLGSAHVLHICVSLTRVSVCRSTIFLVEKRCRPVRCRTR